MLFKNDHPVVRYMKKKQLYTFIVGILAIIFVFNSMDIMDFIAKIIGR